MWRVISVSLPYESEPAFLQHQATRTAYYRFGVPRGAAEAARDEADETSDGPLLLITHRMRRWLRVQL